MPDFKINVISDAASAVSGAQQTSKGFEEVAASVSKAATEAERYAQALEKMAERQSEGKTAGAARQAEDQKWLAEMNERKLALKKKAPGEPEPANPAPTPPSPEDAKSFASWKDLRSAVNGLKMEFPALAQIARLALNPIALAVAGIVAAWGLWNKRVTDMTAALTSMELPDQKIYDPAHISALAEAWKSYGEKLAEAFKGLETIDTDAKRVLDTIDKALARQKALMQAEAAARQAREKATGKEGRLGPIDAAEEKQRERDLEFAARQKKIDVKQAEAAELDKSAGKKLAKAAGIHAGGPANEALVEAGLKADADAATEARKRHQADLDKLNAYQSGEMGYFARKAYEYDYYMKFGLSSADESRAQIQSNLDAAQVPIDRYNKFLKSKSSREAGRKERERLTTEAAGEKAKAAELFYTESANEQEDLDADRGASKRLGLNESLKGAYDALDQGKQHAEELRRKASEQIEKTGAAAKDLTSALGKQEEFNAAIAQFAKRLEEQIKNLRN